MLLETHCLTKRYRELTALNECTLSVKSGEIFGLLGPNGAGKTTLLRLLLGFLKPTSGTATIAGLDCRTQSLDVRRQVAYLPGDARLFRQMRGRDVLAFFADVRSGGDQDRSRQLAKQLELDLSRRVGAMSTGMRQKLALAAALAANTPLIILDEPTSNLDPTVRRIVARLVLEARDRGRTVMFSSHVLSEVEDVCDRVVILRAGKLVHTQAIAELRRRHRISFQLRGEMPEIPDIFREQVTMVRRQDSDHTIETPAELAPLLGWLGTLPLEEVRIEPVGMRAVYEKYHPEAMPTPGTEAS